MNWVGWSTTEGSIRTLIRSIQKLMGGFSKTVPGGLLTTLISNGVVTMVVGLIGAKARKQKLFPSLGHVLGSSLIGSVSVLMMLLSLMAFMHEGSDMAVVTFIVSLSIIFGAGFDRIFFKTTLIPRQFLGIGVYILAGWAILNFPVVASFPIWMLIALAIAFLFAVNDALKRKVRKMDPFINNFWVGITTIVVVSLWLTAIGGWNIANGLPAKFWIWSTVLGFTTAAVLACGLLAYRNKGTIAKVKVAMNGSYLSLAMIVGILVYGESLTAGKVMGAIMFPFAFVLMMDKSSWETIVNFLRKT